MTKYAINQDLTISALNSFSEQDDELAWDLSWDDLIQVHPHAKALQAALTGRETEHQYAIGAASAHGEWRICLTCKNPGEYQSHDTEQRSIVESAGLTICDGIADESGDHALVC